MASGSGIETCINGIDVWFTQLQINALAGGNEIAGGLQDFARSNHPWQNRTGDTERETTASAELTDGGASVTVTLSAGTPYAVYLELARGGKWAWLFIAMLAYRQKMLQTWAARLGTTQKSLAGNVSAGQSFDVGTYVPGQGNIY